MSDEIKQLGIDAIICPAMPVPAMKLGEGHRAICKLDVYVDMFMYNVSDRKYSKDGRK